MYWPIHFLNLFILYIYIFIYILYLYFYLYFLEISMSILFKEKYNFIAKDIYFSRKQL